MEIITDKTIQGLAKTTISTVFIAVGTSINTAKIEYFGFMFVHS